MSRRYGRCGACGRVVRLRAEGRLLVGWHELAHTRRRIADCLGVGTLPAEGAQS
jgi:hypothetical protein